jgi:hypothetical protein
MTKRLDPAIAGRRQFLQLSLEFVDDFEDILMGATPLEIARRFPGSATARIDDPKAHGSEEFR